MWEIELMTNKDLPVDSAINWDNVWDDNLELSQCHNCPLAEQENKCSGLSGWNINSETKSWCIIQIRWMKIEKKDHIYSLQPDRVCAFNEFTANLLFLKSHTVIVPSSPPASLMWVCAGWCITLVNPAYSKIKKISVYYFQSKIF